MSNSNLGGFFERLMGEGPELRPKTLEEADRMAEESTRQWVKATTAVSWIPSSTIMLAGADVKIVEEMAKIYRVRTFKSQAIVAAAATTIAGKATAGVASEAMIWLFPGVGSLVSMGVAAGATKLLCEFVKDYMRERSPLK